jgi:hypothetical protein
MVNPEGLHVVPFVLKSIWLDPDAFERTKGTMWKPSMLITHGCPAWRHRIAAQRTERAGLDAENMSRMYDRAIRMTEKSSYGKE